jgi:hypothetical protein
VKANPLTRCPGNTRGSLASEAPYQAQFNCIRAAGQRRIWYPMHLLHGMTRRTGPRNLHGPGNTRWNIIIGDVNVNTMFSGLVEQPAIRLVYGSNAVLWFETNVDSYFSGNEFFAREVTMSWGIYDVNTGTEGPALVSQRIPSTRTAPSCPPSLPAVVPPAGGAGQGTPTPQRQGPAPDWTSTIEICHRVLRSRVFPVRNGGLRVTLRASWAATGPRAFGGCPADDYHVSLEEQGLIFDSEISTSTVPAGRRITLTWRHLDPGDYYLIIWSPGHNPFCCLRGDISAGTFDAPRPQRIRRSRRTVMA